MKKYSFTAVSMALMLWGCSTDAPIVPEPDEPVIEEPAISYQDIFTQLYWEDNFDGEALNESVWWIQNTDSYNNELQCYKHNNGNVSVGKEPVSGKNCLIITAKRDTCDEHNRYITSGKISTQVGDWTDWVSTTYGRVEASILLPKTYKGLWPAFWMMGTDVGNGHGWASCGEIDILEAGASAGMSTVEKSESYINGACHWGSGWENGTHWYSSRFKQIDYSLQDGDFHLYTLIWTQDSINCYVDLDRYPYQKPYFSLCISRDRIVEGQANNAPQYFHKPFYFMFNLAVGGDYTGIKDPSKITAMDLKDGHAEMYVDYIRVYHAPDESYHTPLEQ
ncbi:MAG: glycoside hydrolase family 16 protein [Paludibacteraceae bacterium]|nr:glycoside hydrolase family 16 protein [Paludibacteraceae bacterium]